MKMMMPEKRITSEGCGTLLPTINVCHEFLWPGSAAGAINPTIMVLHYYSSSHVLLPEGNE